jgi:hypothetical protein
MESYTIVRYLMLTLSFKLQLLIISKALTFKTLSLKV